MKISKFIKRIAALAMIPAIVGIQTGYASQMEDQRKPVRVLILPKFEIGAIAGIFPERHSFFMRNTLPEAIHTSSAGARARSNCITKTASRCASPARERSPRP